LDKLRNLFTFAFMKAIIDAGSTKVSWCNLMPDGSTLAADAPGVNALMMTVEEMRSIFADLWQRTGSRTDIDSIHYYGAGCLGSEVCGKVSQAMPAAIAAAEVEVRSDMVGAARAMCGNSAGVVGIIGTGSNACYFDGTDTRSMVPAMGYILGDEGSGAAMGRALLRAIYKHRISDHIALRHALEAELQMDYPAIIQRVYSQPAANRFLASLTRFIGSHISHPEVSALVDEQLQQFVAINVVPNVPAGADCPVHFIGGVASAFASQLRSCMTRHFPTLRLGSIESSPMPGLIRYHQSITS
jgi:N-acetylglucosamine kinase-like BadF-type ATPase